jgi:hypothetical protein
MSGQEDASRIYFGGFMQTQILLKTTSYIFDFSTYRADPNTVVESFDWLTVQSKPIETKVGTIPANFFL